MEALTAVLKTLLAMTLTAQAAVTTGLTSFRNDMMGQLKSLDTEINQLKNKEKFLTDEQRASFSKDYTQIKTKWQSLNDSVQSLKKDDDTQKSRLSAGVNDLERLLDDAEKNYDEKHLGLGDLLGM